MRKRRGRSLDEHPIEVQRFVLDEWPGAPAEALSAWRRNFFEYWHGRRHPGGLFGILAATTAARHVVATGEVIDLSGVIVDADSLRAWRQGEA